MKRKKLTKSDLFLIGSPGMPWSTKINPKRAQMSTRATQTQVLGSKVVPQMCATIGTATTVLGSSF